MVISAAYAVITFLLTLVNYFKLESSYQQFSILANRYEKLHTSLELANNQLIFIDNDIEQNKTITRTIREFENKLSDIVNVIVPMDVKLLFPVICNINIFSFIRKIECQKRTLIVQYKDVKNEIRYIKHDCGGNKNRLQSLLNTKEIIKNEIIQYKDVYNSIDAEFTREIQIADAKIKKWFWVLFFGTGKGEPINNLIIKRYMNGSN